MASYNVRLYQNTGFNGVNIPDSPAQLNKCAYIDLADPVELLQNINLTTVTVPCSWEDAQDVDYIRIGNWYYSVPEGGAQMQGTDTCLFMLLSDPLTSAGGFAVDANGVTSAKFSILDGITDRCTVSDDAWGAYTQQDPLVAPQEPLELQTEWLHPPENAVEGLETVSGDPIFVESTADLPMQQAFQNGISYTDEETGETVTVPMTFPVTDSSKTDFTLDEGAKTSDGTKIYVKNNSYTADYSSINAGDVVANGMQSVRALGQDNGTIINQWKVPKRFLKTVTTHYYQIGQTSICEPETTGIEAGGGDFKSTISPDYAPVKNKRVLYGECNKYGLITTAGNSCEFKPEDLEGRAETAPTISFRTDPRPDGKPFYRFKTINNNTDFWRNALAGAEWENVPLVYQGASGSALNRLNFDNERKIASLNKEQYNTNNTIQQAQNVAQTIGNVADSITPASYAMKATRSGWSETYTPGNSEGVFGAIVGGISNAATLGVAREQYKQMYNAQKANELSQLYQSTEIYAPTVNFPYNANMLRDVKGNAVLVYKYKMTDNDVRRIDKLLTMYGYKYAEPLTLDNFTRRKHFDYVACQSVTVTGLPRWWNDAIGQMLRNGVRIWHELPNVSAYADNPVR